MVGVRTMQISDYDVVLGLWSEAAGIGLSQADSRENIAAFLARNPGLSWVWEADSAVVGTALCGHDGRRGYLYHVYVKREWRKQGIGEAMVESCLASLAADGIQKCHLYAYCENTNGASFWERLGWQRRGDLIMYSKNLEIKRSTRTADS